VTANALILFGHGARDPRWAEPFHRLQAMLTEQAGPDVAVRLAFLELMQPSLPDVIADLAAHGCKSVRIVPVFFGQGGHLRNDFPVLLADCQAAHPDVQIQSSPPVGEWLPVLQAIVAGALHSGA
jgi:sirohydrochlorin cobaltochelatase